MTVIKLEAELPIGDSLVFERKRKHKEKVPSFSCIGGNMNYETRVKSYPDLFGAFSKLSKGAHWFLWTLVKKRSSTNNMARYTPQGSGEHAKVSRAYKELKEKNIVFRTERSTYLINPKVILPDNGCFDEAWSKWCVLTGEKYNDSL